MVRMRRRVSWRLLSYAFLLVAVCACADTPKPVASTIPSPGATASATPSAEVAPPVEAVPDGPSVTYALDCGPLDEARCQEDATRLVAAIEADADKRVVALEFTTICGSYTLLLEDGTGIGAAIDCVPRPFPSD